AAQPARAVSASSTARAAAIRSRKPDSRPGRSLPDAVPWILEAPKAPPEPLFVRGLIPLELGADLLRLFRFQGQSALPVLDGALEAPLLLGQVTQVLLDGRVVRIGPVRLPQIPLRDVQLPQPKVDPSERIAVGPIARLPLDGFLQHGLRFAEMDVAI